MARPSSPSTRAAASRALSLPELRPVLLPALTARALLGVVPLAMASVFVWLVASFFADMVVLPMVALPRQRHTAPPIRGSTVTGRANGHPGNCAGIRRFSRRALTAVPGRADMRLLTGLF